jgi:hypothetical protein
MGSTRIAVVAEISNIFSEESKTCCFRACEIVNNGGADASTTVGQESDRDAPVGKEFERRLGIVRFAQQRAWLHLAGNWE